VRAKILASYLGHVDHDVDIDRVAARTRGHSGADLRELVRRAVIESDGTPTTDDLLALVDGSHRPSHPGLYL
jgi:hypothetical protein